MRKYFIGITNLLFILKLELLDFAMLNAQIKLRQSLGV